MRTLEEHNADVIARHKAYEEERRKEKGYPGLISCPKCNDKIYYLRHELFTIGVDRAKRSNPFLMPVYCDCGWKGEILL